jgi:hypothetical protein
MHLPGGPSTSETFAPASGFQVRKHVEAGLKPLDFTPKNNMVPTEENGFYGVGNGYRNKRGMRGKPR